MVNLKYVPLRLEPDLLDHLDSIAIKRAIPRAAVMREGLHFFVQRHAIMSEAEYRRVLADEFVFLALDTIIQRRHADVHAELLNEAAKRAGALRGYREECSNPCRGIRFNRKRKYECFLSNEELARLGAALEDLKRDRFLPAHPADRSS